MPSHGPRGDPHMTRGLAKRESELAAAQEELRRFNEEMGDVRPGMAMTGSVHLRQRIATAERARDRQQAEADRRRKYAQAVGRRLAGR